MQMVYSENCEESNEGRTVGMSVCWSEMWIFFFDMANMGENCWKWMGNQIQMMLFSFLWAIHPPSIIFFKPLCGLRTL